jgi:predicted nucleic acid-binding protein
LDDWRGASLGLGYQEPLSKPPQLYAPAQVMLAPTVYLVDTSVWIPLLRRSPPHEALATRVTNLIRADLVATTGLVRLEVLRGARDEAHLARLRTMMDGLQQLPTSEHTWDDAAMLGMRLQHAGLVTQSSDLLIAAGGAARGRYDLAS